MSDVKFMLSMPSELRVAIKREAYREGITMNEYICAVMDQFIKIKEGERKNVIEGLTKNS